MGIRAPNQIFFVVPTGDLVVEIVVVLVSLDTLPRQLVDQPEIGIHRPELPNQLRHHMRRDICVTDARSEPLRTAQTGCPGRL